MGKRESYEPGMFCSVDLATTDAEGAKRFYGGLFGWEGEDVHLASAETPSGGCSNGRVSRSSGARTGSTT